MRHLLRPIRRVVGWDGFWWMAGMVAVLVIGALLSWRYWDELRGDQDSLSTTIRNVALVIGGIIAGLLAIWRSKVAERQADTAQRGLLNERYQKGAEMLGGDVLSVRLGGIYALERLAAEHPQQYHVQVMKLFCAFVRNAAGEGRLDAEPDDEEGGRKPQLREDVQAVMTAIGGRGELGCALEREAELTLDLHGARLSFARLSGMNLAGVDLSKADLRMANFFATHMLPPNLSEPIPSGPDQPEARIGIGEHIAPNLEGMEGRRANLCGSHLDGADLSGAYFLGTNLSGAILVNARLSDSTMIYSNLRKAVLLGADLTRATILESDLSGAQLAHSRLAEAQFPGTKLYGANFFGACLRGTDVSGAVLSKNGGEFRATGLTQAQIDQVKVDPPNPPSLAGVIEVGSRKPLVWRGGPVESP